MPSGHANAFIFLYRVKILGWGYGSILGIFPEYYVGVGCVLEKNNTRGVGKNKLGGRAREPLILFFVNVTGKLGEIGVGWG